MSRLLTSDLDGYSRFVLPLILERFPEWEQFADLQHHPDGAGSTIEFTVPCPSPVAEYGLWVSTADEELTVGFHTHHNHFTNYETRLNREVVQEGIKHAADILAERVGILSMYRGGQLVCSRTVELPQAGPLPELLADYDWGEAVAELVSGCDRATLRSWQGRFDCEKVQGDPPAEE